jgi:O-antigen/teichoic acid export membrane protein
MRATTGTVPQDGIASNGIDIGDGGSVGPARPSLRSSAARASVWTLLGFGGSRFLRLASNLVLTRLLFPEAFGIMAIVQVFLLGMQMLSDLGIGPSIIQNDRGDDARFLNTAWTLQILRGVGIWLILVVAAWPVSMFYEQPLLRWLLPVVGFSAVLSGFESTAQFTLNRHLALGKVTMLELGSQIVAVVVMIVWAVIHPSIWALAVGAVVGRLVRTVWSHFLIPGVRNRLLWDKQCVSAVIHFGKWIFLSSAVGFLASQVDRLVLPKLIDVGMFGVYGIAFMLSAVPDQIVASLGYKVVFPTVSKRAHLPRPVLRAAVQRARWPFICLLAVVTSLVAMFGDVAVRWLYDPRYHAAAWMLSILAFGLWPRVLTNTINPSLLAIGQPRYVALSGMARFLLLTPGLLLGYHYVGLPGVVAAVALSGCIDYVVESLGLWRHGLVAIRQDLMATGVWVALLVVFMLVRTALGLGLPFAGAL